MGFKEYAQNCENNSKQNEFKQNQETKKIEKIYDSLKDKNEDELLNELFKNVNKQKEDGTFDYVSLKETINKISAFLTPEQKTKINDLLEKIK